MLDAAMQTQLKTYLANLREPIELPQAEPNADDHHHENEQTGEESGN